jgi:uncharacterized membrane protein
MCHKGNKEELTAQEANGIKLCAIFVCVFVAVMTFVVAMLVDLIVN